MYVHTYSSFKSVYSELMDNLMMMYTITTPVIVIVCVCVCRVEYSYFCVYTMYILAA